MTQDPKAAQETSGARAAAEISAFLNQLSSARPRDWERMLGEIRKAVAQLVKFDLISQDRTARLILERMVYAADMEEFAWEVDLLGLRVAELLALKDSDTHAPVLSTGHGRQDPMTQSAHTRVVSEEAPLRTFLRL